MTGHISREMLQLLADGQLDKDASASAQRHLTECQECSSSLEEMKSFDRFLRAMPSPVLGRHFTENLLTRLGIERRPSVMFRLLGHAASFVSILLVLLMGGSIWALLAFAGWGKGIDEDLPGQRAVDGAGKWLGDVFVGLGSWMSQVSGFFPGSQAGRIVVILLIIVTLVFVSELLFSRRRSA
jgi:hypothetical protein